MKRFYVITLGLAASLLLAACGGGGTSDVTDTSDSSDNQTVISVEGSGNGSHTVSYVDGKLNVRFGGEAEDFANVVESYGYSVEFTDGNYASVEIGDDDPEQAITTLEKEYSVFSAERVQQVTIPSGRSANEEGVRTVSYIPLDPFYSDMFVSLDYDSDSSSYVYSTFFGQAWPMNSMGFDGAWDFSDPQNEDGQVAAETVRIAIIDAGWLDYSTEDRVGFDETLIDTANSGSVAGDGSFTPGLDAATWDTYIYNGTSYFIEYPYRTTGEAMLGILAASHDDYNPMISDLDGDSAISEDELWNEGMAGINPNATYVLIKTGSGDNSDYSWTFTDQQVAASIEHAWDTADCDIILLGMYVSGTVPTDVQTAITNARNNGAIVIAPAGDVVDSYSSGAFTDTAVDITVNPVWPAAATGCLSVTGTGYNRIGTLSDVNVNSTPVANNGTGWYPTYSTPFDEPFYAVASYCNTGADIAGMGWGFGFGQRDLFVNGSGTEADPYVFITGEAFASMSTARFSTTYSAAYVAGAASIVFQGLSYANGTAPTPDEVESCLLDTVQFGGMTGILDNGGYLNANAAMADAIADGTLFEYAPSMAFTTATGSLGDWFSQTRAAVTRSTDLSVSPTIVNGTAPFDLEVDWGNGEDTVTVTGWNSGDAVTLTGGYTDLGSKTLVITVTDTNGQTISIPPEVFVINPLAASITIEDSTGSVITSLKKGVQYRFKSNISNVYTGDLGGTENAMSYNWWLESDPDADAPDATNENPVYTFATAGTYEVTLHIEETVRPGLVVTRTVSVAN